MNEACSICLDSISPTWEEDPPSQGNAIVKFACAHFFHKECIFEWLHRATRQCPLCRTVVVGLLPGEREHQLKSLNTQLQAAAENSGNQEQSATLHFYLKRAFTQLDREVVLLIWNSHWGADHRETIFTALVMSWLENNEKMQPTSEGQKDLILELIPTIASDALQIYVKDIFIRLEPYPVQRVSAFGSLLLNENSLGCREVFQQGIAIAFQAKCEQEIVPDALELLFVPGIDFHKILAQANAIGIPFVRELLLMEKILFPLAEIRHFPNLSNQERMAQLRNSSVNLEIFQGAAECFTVKGDTSRLRDILCLGRYILGQELFYDRVYPAALMQAIDLRKAESLNEILESPFFTKDATKKIEIRAWVYTALFDRRDSELFLKTMPINFEDHLHYIKKVIDMYCAENLFNTCEFIEWVCAEKLLSEEACASILLPILITYITKNLDLDSIRYVLSISVLTRNPDAKLFCWGLACQLVADITQEAEHALLQELLNIPPIPQEEAFQFLKESLPLDACLMKSLTIRGCLNGN